MGVAEQRKSRIQNEGKTHTKKKHASLEKSTTTSDRIVPSGLPPFFPRGWAWVICAAIDHEGDREKIDDIEHREKAPAFSFFQRVRG